MAGLGKRFVDAGYKLPKPLIDVDGKEMIQVVLDSLNLEGNYVFIVQKEQAEKYDFHNVLSKKGRNYTLLTTEGLTCGAACTTLIAEGKLDDSEPLLIVNSDQYIKWDSNRFISSIGEEDGIILTFNSDEDKFSYVREEGGKVIEVAEKRVISNKATVGIYYWKSTKYYFDCVRKMMELDKKVNGEFYICPVYNEAIDENKIIKTYDVEEMQCLGTPDDLKRFVERK